MNLAASIAATAALLSIGMAAVGWRVARAPGWDGLRWFSVVALSSAVYATGNIATVTGQPDRIVILASHFQAAAVMVQVYAWFKVADGLLGRRPPVPERWLVGALLAGAAACLVPGGIHRGEVSEHRFAPWDATYHDAVPSPLGEALYLATLIGGIVVVVRLALAWRRGRPGAAPQCLGLSALLVLGTNDALAASGLADTPYLLDIGFLLPVASLAWIHANRFVGDAEALIGLRGRLESLVEARTRELASAQERLHQAEKLAGLGQFAAGVAHEVNNPAAVVTANLRYLTETAIADGAPREAVTALEESLEAMRRINGLVRRLVDAGRLAAAPAAAGTCAVRAVAEQAVAEARARSGERVAYALEVPDGLHAGLRAEVLHQILGPLLLNATDAIPTGQSGRIEVRAAPGDDGRLHLEVRDDGAGMAPEVLRRAFEPFFTTRGEGRGSGLGLPVARALAESHGGDLALESRPGQGTVARLLLPEAPQAG